MNEIDEDADTLVWEKVNETADTLVWVRPKIVAPKPRKSLMFILSLALKHTKDMLLSRKVKA